MTQSRPHRARPTSKWLRLLFLLVCLQHSALGLAIELDPTVTNQDPIGRFLQVLTEGEQQLELADLITPTSGTQWQTVKEPVLRLGIGSKPVWMRLTVNNPSNAILERRLVIETAWLDKVDVFFLEDGLLINQFASGDRLPFSQRPKKHRFFIYDHGYALGATTVLIRVETVDPMTLPVYFMSSDDYENRSLVQIYSYGILYGALLALLIYNLMLFLGLADKRYLFFSLYLASFLLTNIAYTGHGYQWFWPESPSWQQFVIPVSMCLFNISGLIFALQFLQIKHYRPRVYSLTIIICVIAATLQLSFIASNNQQGSLLLSFYLTLILSSMMFCLGILSLRSGNRSAWYFLFAAIAGSVGATITACSVLGYIPFNKFTYRATDIGMLLDIILLAFALADKFQSNEKAKTEAEQIARVDPLTLLNNRRAFYEQVKPLWQLGLRKKQAMSVILFDLDNFKAINDSYGHAAGDDVLIEVARVLDKGVRASDISGRWGGEEFIVFLPETDLAGSQALADKIRSMLLEHQTPVNEKSVTVTASFGVAQNPDGNNNLDQVISAADKNLYVAKNKGRNYVHAS